MKKRKIILLILAVLFFSSIILLINLRVFWQSRGLIFENIENAPSKQTALILGARVLSNGKMSDILSDRVKSALELYDNGKVKKILVSGDHGRIKYDEVNTIKKYLLENGASPEDIFLDHAGFDTYDSLYRAKEIFKVDSVIIVTQKFHLPRSIYIGKSLGIESYGFVADKQKYLGMQRYKLREILARVKAFFNIAFHSKSKYGGEPIPITGDGRLSWD